MKLDKEDSMTKISCGACEYSFIKLRGEGFSVADCFLDREECLTKHPSLAGMRKQLAIVYDYNLFRSTEWDDPDLVVDLGEPENTAPPVPEGIGFCFDEMDSDCPGECLCFENCRDMIEEDLSEPVPEPYRPVCADCGALRIGDSEVEEDCQANCENCNLCDEPFPEDLSEPVPKTVESGSFFGDEFASHPLVADYDEEEEAFIMPEPLVEPAEDMVDHPAHYAEANIPSGIECWDWYELAMTEAEFTGHMKGNVLKYVFRAGKKSNAIEDLEKARAYLKRWITYVEGHRTVHMKGQRHDG